MIILIPIGGLGERLKKKGFKKPKALIKVKEKEIIFHLLDNLIINSSISI
jgi:NDP-sugar pyrophosphorylase family protein